MSTAPSVATSWKCSKIHLDSVGHVNVGHLHPPPDPTSGVGHVTILVTGAYAVAVLCIQYFPDALPGGTFRYLQELVGFWNNL